MLNFEVDLAFTAKAQRARREKLKHLCVLGVSAVHVSYSTFKWRTPLHPSYYLVNGRINAAIGASPSGKAADFGSAIRWFESSRPSSSSSWPN